MLRRFRLAARLRCVLLSNLLLEAALASVVVVYAHAKEPPLTAILLYNGPNGPAYLELTDLLLNGKAEVRSCGTAQLIDRPQYGKLAKVSLSGADSLERRADGTLLLTQGGNVSCVVPANLKLDKGEALSAAELASRGELLGRVLSGESSIPPLKPGVKLVFVRAPDVELAEYLRAERANTITGWQDYLSRYPKTSHMNQANMALATLLTEQGQARLASYRRAEGSASSYDDLRGAKQSADQSLELAPNSATTTQLLDSIQGELRTLTDRGRAEWQAYEEALSAHTAGYSHLVVVRNLVNQVLEIDSHFEPAQNLLKSVSAATNRFENSLRNAQLQLEAEQPDDAVAAIGSYRVFAAEEPRVAAVLDAAYKLHFQRGMAAESAQQWQEAVQEFQKASNINQRAEAAAALKNAEAGLEASHNREIADAALRKSQDMQQEQNYLEAYEVLYALPAGARALVTDPLHALEPAYIRAAAQKAKQLEDAHTPIRNRADEVAIHEAHQYLERARDLSPDDENLKLRLDQLAQKLSDYCLAQARKYLERPQGSGVGLAWLYLDEAQHYKPGRDDVLQERARSSALYQMRSRLSLRVAFYDQTSRRDSGRFAEQLSDAITAGLESSGPPVKVIRPNETAAAEPNFQILGEVLQHRPIRNETVEAMESRYRVGAHEVSNDEWNRANRDYQAAAADLQSAQRALEAAQAHGSKSDIADANRAVALAQQHVDDARRELDSTAKTSASDITKPYNYTRKTIDVAAIVEVSFRIVDSSYSVVEAAPPVSLNNHKEFIVLENVKPEDTEGVRALGATPDEQQVLADVEIEARDTLIKAVREHVEKLPGRILDQARRRAVEGDPAAAAEAYILYLHCSPPGQQSEQDEAKRFLLEQFNLKLSATAPS